MIDTLTYKGYEGNIDYSEDDDMYFGEVQGISDCVLYEGRNFGELKNDFENAVNDYIALCEEEGMSPETPSYSDDR